jgi:hypothetical protein
MVDRINLAAQISTRSEITSALFHTALKYFRKQAHLFCSNIIVSCPGYFVVALNMKKMAIIDKNRKKAG